MLIIFQPNVNKNPRALWILVATLLSLLAQAHVQTTQ